ncbi:MAG: exo-alpha-sialidase [Gemmatimonadaceae bacterium]|nr:exo-alpha-sialidase [Gemmatimonadaceae bacterium]
MHTARFPQVAPCVTLVALTLLGSSVPAAQPPPAATPSTVSVGPNRRLVPGEYNEMWVAVSPTTPNVMVAVAQVGSGDGGTGGRHSATMVSRDGGNTWVTVSLPGYTAGAFDPMVVVGPDGRFYVMQCVIGGSFARAMSGPEASQPAAIRIWTTTGDAWTWDGPTEIHPSVQPDHARLVVDMSQGPHRGRVYLAWNDVYDSFVRDQYAMFLQYSDDHGKSFSDPTLIDLQPGGKLVATEPVVLSDGTVLVTYYQYWNPLGDPRNERLPMFVRRSTDGAKTFSPPEKVFDFGPHIWPARRGEFPRAFSLPIVVADTSSTSPNRDHIYATWDDTRSGHSDIWFSRSTDKGRSWSPPLRVNDNTRNVPLGVADFRMTPVVAVAPRGEIGIAWYDRRGDPARRCWEYLFAFSIDGGQRFSANHTVSSAASCPPPSQGPGAYVHNLSPFDDPNRPPDSTATRLSTMERFALTGPEFVRRARDEAHKALTNGRIVLSFDGTRNLFAGHYTGLAADRGGAFNAVWADRRSGKQELYGARITLGAPTAVPGALTEADLTDRVEVVAGTPVYDAASGTARLQLQLRNVSRQPVYGPLRLDIVGIATAGGQPTAALVDSAGVALSASTVAFSGKLGSADRLAPREMSEAVEVVLKLRPGAGFDTALDFRVKGRAVR